MLKQVSTAGGQSNLGVMRDSPRKLIRARGGVRGGVGISSRLISEVAVGGSTSAFSL